MMYLPGPVERNPNFDPPLFGEWDVRRFMYDHRGIRRPDTDDEYSPEFNQYIQTMDSYDAYCFGKHRNFDSAYNLGRKRGWRGGMLCGFVLTVIATLLLSAICSSLSTGNRGSDAPVYESSRRAEAAHSR